MAWFHEEPSFGLSGVKGPYGGAARGVREELIGIRIRRRARVSRPPDPAQRSVGI
jgi:hypothetical protein